MANTSLTRTFTTDNSNVYKWTYSFWVKRSKLGVDQAVTATYSSSTYQSRIIFRSDDQLEIFDLRNNLMRVQKKTTRKFRDTSAWYNIVISNDNTQASADDRTKIYVNGVQETSFSTNTQYTQNQATSFNSNYPNYIGTYSAGDYFNGSISHFHFIDGTAYDATAFGEYDANGVWKIKTSPSVTYGTNGFFILKDGNSVTDQSPNTNNFTVAGGTLTKTEDNPSNVFCTMNPLAPVSSVTFSNGNLKLVGSNQTNYSSRSNATIGVSQGKWYMETEIDTKDGNSQGAFGVGLISTSTTVNPTTQGVGDVIINMSKSLISPSGNTANYTGTINNGDIFGIALDMDNGKVYFSQNGTWLNSSNPATSTNPAYTGLSGDTCILFRPLSGTYIANFGNGYFGTTAVSSAGTNASGNGIFEYDVPTGYTALSTKGLNL
jgi:hypothetical protein